VRTMIVTPRVFGGKMEQSRECSLGGGDRLGAVLRAMPSRSRRPGGSCELRYVERSSLWLLFADVVGETCCRRKMRRCGCRPPRFSRFALSAGTE
ncbi:MAG: hypothetical protein D6820_10070, partial [Lentisphaerae bacterium]